MGWVILLLICCTAVGMAVIKTVRFFFPKKKGPVLYNPYIEHQRIKKLNETWYGNYLLWMQKNDPEGVPVDKLQADEDIKANDKFKGLFN